MLFCKDRKVKISKIKIPDEFIESRPHPEKVIKKTADYILNGELDKIYIDEDNNLIDGYISYLILKEFEVKTAKTVIVKENRREQ